MGPKIKFILWNATKINPSSVAPSFVLPTFLSYKEVNKNVLKEENQLLAQLVKSFSRLLQSPFCGPAQRLEKVAIVHYSSKVFPNG